MSDVISGAPLSAGALKNKLSLLMDSVISSSKSCSEQLRHAPLLASVIREYFDSQMNEQISISNSDILFMDARDVDSSLSGAMSLTRVFMYSMLRGHRDLAKRNIRIFTRHDSFDRKHQLNADDTFSIWRNFNVQLEQLPYRYLAGLGEFWVAPLAVSVDGRTTRLKLFSDHQHQLMKDEVSFLELSNKIDAQDKIRLLELGTSLKPEGVFNVALALPGRAISPFAATYVIAKDPATRSPQQISGACYLLTPVSGLVKFHTFAQLSDYLKGLLATPATESGLVSMLPLSEQEALAQLPSVSLEMLRFEEQSSSLFHAGALVVQSKQASDFIYLLQRAQYNLVAVEAFLHDWAPYQTLDHVDEVARHRVQQLTKAADSLSRPRWFRHGDETHKRRLQQLEAESLVRVQQLDSLVEPMESVEFYAHHKMAGYMREYLGCVVDPTQVHITWTCRLPEHSKANPVNRRKTLLDLAVEGAPDNMAGAFVTLPRSLTNPALDMNFIENMLAELDVRRSYELDWTMLQRSSGIEQAVVTLRQSAIDLAVATAVMQNRLTERGQALIDAVKTGQRKAGSFFSLSGISLMALRNRFKDAILFCERREDDEYYVLFAPGAPGDTDLMEFDTWRKLSFTIGGWLQYPEGARYVQEQVCAQPDPHVIEFIQIIQALPSRWSPESVIRGALDTRDYNEAMTILVRDRIELQLRQRKLTVAADHINGSYEERQSIASLRDQIEMLNTQYLALTDLMSYREFARQRGSIIAERALQAQGIDRQVDPDQLFVDPDGSIDRNDADVAFATRFSSLTDLFMKGFYQGIFSPYRAPKLVGGDWDISRELSQMLIDAAGKTRFGEMYIEQVEREMGSHSANYPRRRALYAARKQCEIQLDALLAKARGELDPDQYDWVNAMVLSVTGTSNVGSAQAPRVARSSVNVLHINDRLIEGTLIFRDFGTTDPAFSLAYTPRAPDGQTFRRTSDFRASLRTAGMAQYYYERASYRDQRVIGSLMASYQIPDANDTTEASITLVAEHRVTYLETLYDDMLQRILDDVDKQTESVAETSARYLYVIVKLAGSIALLPFPGASLAWGILHSAIDVSRGVLAYREGDRAAAGSFFFSAWLGAFGAAKGIREISVGTGYGTRAIVWVARRPVFWKNFHVLM